MDGLKFYSMFEMPKGNTHFPGLDLEKDFPGMVQAVAGSIEYHTYEACTTAAIQFLKSKLAVLNAHEERYKIFFEKNQFNSTQGGDWSENEIVKIYIADSLQTVYNSQFTSRVFFVKDLTDIASFFEAPTTLQ